MGDFDAYCKQHFISYCRELSDCCPYCRIAELEARYKAASGLALAWGNYFNRESLEKWIDHIVRKEALKPPEHGDE